MPGKTPGKAPLRTVAMKSAQALPAAGVRRLPSKATAIDAPAHAADSDWQTF
jgi:hypothetical protein